MRVKLLTHLDDKDSVDITEDVYTAGESTSQPQGQLSFHLPPGSKPAAKKMMPRLWSTDNEAQQSTAVSHVQLTLTIVYFRILLKGRQMSSAKILGGGGGGGGKSIPRGGTSPPEIIRLHIPC